MLKLRPSLPFALQHLIRSSSSCYVGLLSAFFFVLFSDSHCRGKLLLFSLPVFFTLILSSPFFSFHFQCSIRGMKVLNGFYFIWLFSLSWLFVLPPLFGLFSSFIISLSRKFERKRKVCRRFLFELFSGFREFRQKNFRRNIFST